MSAETLNAYLTEISARPFALGMADCCTFMADWLVRLGLPDVMEDRRGKYATLRDYQRMLLSEGGLIAACHRRFTSAGLNVATVPKAGDVAVVLLPYARQRYTATGAIMQTENRAIMLTNCGLVATRSRPVAKVWSRA